jgi:type II secretory pathway pseudopilin PulG
MNNKATALILALFVILVLGILSSSFLYKQINQSFLANRYTDSVQALWAAESGVQAARSNNNLTHSSLGGTVGAGSFAVDISQIGSSNYYRVVSTGTMGGVARTIDSVVSTRDVNASKFRYGLEASGEIDFKGATSVWGENTTPNPPPSKTYDPEYYKENSTFGFADLFSFSSAEIKDLSTVYVDAFPGAGFSGINWIDDPDAHYNGDIDGSGILIINGSVRITGTIDFDGIIYVIGELDMAGTAYVNGSILAESGANVDTTVTGTADIQHNRDKIAEALSVLAFRSPQVVSWKELIQ